MKKTISKILIMLCSVNLITNISNISYATETTNDSSIKISSKYAIVVNMDTNEVIYSQNADTKAQMASTTKLMTAILLSENRKKTDYLQMSAAAKALPSSSITKDKLPSMAVGEKITADNVMKGLLLSSGNDMADIIAEDISGSVDSFSTVMNDRAEKIGMKNTVFYTPNGLDTDSILDGHEHYSTAYDMSLLGIEAYKHDWIRETIAKDKFEFQTESGLKCELQNTNSNLNKNGCLGGKTGYTDKAGKCLVAFYNKEGKNLIGVVLGGENHVFFNDMTKIIDYSAKKPKEILINERKPLEQTTVSFKPSKYTKKEVSYDIPVFVKDDIEGYKNDYNDKNTEISVNINENIDTQNLDENTVIGTLDIKTNYDTKSYDLYTSSSTNQFIEDSKEYTNKIDKNVSLIKWAIISIIILLIFGIFIIRNKRKQMKRRQRMRQRQKQRNIKSMR